MKQANTYTSIQNLHEHMWAFAILLAFADTGILSKLQTGTDLNQLQTQIEPTILKNMLEVLIYHNFVIQTGQKFHLSPELNQEIDQIGFNNFVASLRLTFGQTNVFVNEVRNNTLKMGWRYTDEIILQSMGSMSGGVVNYFIDNEDIHAALSKPNAIFVDVGTGMGRISLKMCELYPNLRAIGIEPADTPYSLAVKNVKESPYANRVTLQKIYAQDIKESNAFDVVWFPHGFLINDNDFMDALTAIYNGLKPGGILLSGNLQSDKMPIDKKFLFSMCCLDRGLDNLVKQFTAAGFKTVKILPEKDKGITPLMAIK